MKINDIGIQEINGNLIVGQKNKRGNIKSGGLNITNVVLDWLVKLLVSDKDKTKVYEVDGIYYSVNITKMTEDDVKSMKEKRKAEKTKSHEDLNEYMNYIYRKQDSYSPYLEAIKSIRRW